MVNQKNINFRNLETKVINEKVTLAKFKDDQFWLVLVAADSDYFFQTIAGEEYVAKYEGQAIESWTQTIASAKPSERFLSSQFMTEKEVQKMIDDTCGF